MSANHIQLLIADDNASFRDGLKALLETEPDLALVGEAIGGLEAVEQAVRLQPEVVLMDLQMPDLNGIEATRRILETSPHIRVLVLTMFEDDASVFAALRAGARGYLVKGAMKAEIVRAVRSVHDGEAIFGPAIARRLLGYFSSPRGTPEPFPELTKREREVLELIAAFNGNAATARQLSISPKTVRNHISNIFSKLQVADRAEAIARAREAGLGQADEGSSRP